MNISNRGAIIRIDLQKTFCPGGNLPVAGGDEIIAGINALSAIAASKGFDIIDTQDWHPANHKSFASMHDLNPYDVIEMPYGEQTLWPDHAVQGTDDAAFHPDLDTDIATAVIRKGMNPDIDSYSAFFENDHVTATGLGAFLKERGITKVIMVGLAYDFCVGFSAIDAHTLGFEVTVVRDLCRGIGLPDEVHGDTINGMTARFKLCGIIEVAKAADIW